MSNCILKIDKLQIEPREVVVFYAANDLIAYKSKLHFFLADCHGTILSKTRCPADYIHFEFLEFDDALLFCFAGKTIMLVDKYGNNTIEHEFPIKRFGRITTSLLSSSNEYGVLFGCNSRDTVHFIHLDYITGKRIWQSASLKLNTINDIIATKNHLYALLDHTFIACYDIKTGQTVWTRFETGRIYPKLIARGSDLFYTCEGVIKRFDGKECETIKIPATRSAGLQAVYNNNYLISLAQEGKSVARINIDNKTKEWEVPGTSKIHETLIIQGKNRSTIHNYVLARTDNNLAIINADYGRVSHSVRVEQFIRMHACKDHVLLHKQNNKTSLLVGL